MNPRGIRATTLLLATIAAAGVGTVAVVHTLTAPAIAERERETRQARMEAVLAGVDYDNDPAEDTRRVRDPRLGSTTPVRIHRAREGGEPRAVVLPLEAPDGYSGPIRLLLAATPDGRVLGVRVLAHRETPGLGDAIEAGRSDWLTQFPGRRLGDPPAPAWTVRSEGGAFEGITGATITPRAVVRAVARGLAFIEAEGEALFAEDGTHERRSDHGGDGLRRTDP